MSYLIAVSGKGGVGKTTLSALIVRRLVEAGKTPVLAIDADPNSCLDAALGVAARNSVGQAREEVREAVNDGLAGISKQELLQMKIAQSLVESRGFDLIAMGRPEGPGCYCYANNVLKSVIAQLSSNYPYVVLDNEAGLENLSRRIVQHVDVLLLVSDAGSAGINTLKRLHALAKEMGVTYGKLFLLINRGRSDAVPPLALETKEATGADGVFYLPDDAEIAAFAERNESLLALDEGNPVYGMIKDLIAQF